MIPLAPVVSSIRWAFCGELISPLAITGMPTAATTSRTVWNSASPLNLSARVRPWIASAWIPACSAMRAMATALRSSRVGPVRIFRVTGTSTAATTASRIRATRSGSESSAEPAARLHTFFAGQPMLISMICAPRSTLARAACASMSGSPPAICTDTGPGSPLWSSRWADLRVSHSRVSEVTISDTTSPAPSSRHKCRKGRSVTPAMGARIKGLGSR